MTNKQRIVQLEKRRDNTDTQEKINVIEIYCALDNGAREICERWTLEKTTGEWTIEILNASDKGNNGNLQK